jgi:hypothetical protein
MSGPEPPNDLVLPSPEPDPDRKRRVRLLQRKRRRRLLLGIVKWAGALLLASLVIPAITTQWSDRQKEVALKDSLISQLTASTATAIENSGSLVFDETQGPAIAPIATLRSQFKSIGNDWNIQAFTLESQLHAYFPHARLYHGQHSTFGHAFDTYNMRVQDYILLAYALCPGDKLRTKALRRLQIYLPIIKSVEWAALQESGVHPPGNDCWRRSTKFKDAYLIPLGLDLLRKRAALVDTILHSHATGYNVGFQDFLRQVLPFY